MFVGLLLDPPLPPQSFIEDPVSKSKSQGRKGTFPPVVVSDPQILEERIKRELVELGLLDPPEVHM